MCFSRLLDTAAAADARRGGSRRSSSSSSAVVGAAAGAGEVGKAAAAAQQAGRGARAVDTLRGKLPAVVKAAQHQTLSMPTTLCGIACIRRSPACQHQHGLQRCPVPWQQAIEHVVASCISYQAVS
eukprot:16101-Heterococcus_DN1.PRE.2